MTDALPPIPAQPIAVTTCPRCGEGFHCGAHDAAPCACSGLTLPVALQKSLRNRYAGCLCLACLRSLAEAETKAE